MHISSLVIGIQEMRIGVSAIQGQHELERIQKFVDWLSPLSFRDRDNYVLSRRCERTGQCRFDTSEASSWLMSAEKSSL